jgi:RNA ligase (TIGR02306 family)
MDKEQQAPTNTESGESGLVYVGKIISIVPIENADYVVSATVVCGHGGKWRGVVRKEEYAIDDKCIVYLPDSLIPQSDEMHFMAATKWRVRMRRFRGAPSEVVIMPYPYDNIQIDVGIDVTFVFNVTKYQKPLPAQLNGEALAYFPSFIPKTDEPNYQRSQDLINMLEGKPYYITEKCDGSSTTAYRYKGHFGICSRNLELVRNVDNGYWQVALKYNLEELLPEGYALQWETCGPGIQSNPMGLKEIDGYAFSAYKIDEHRYLDGTEFKLFCYELNFPTVCLLAWSIEEGFSSVGIEILGEGNYANGKPREGVVVRSMENLRGHAPISFKVINLGYDK